MEIVASLVQVSSYNVSPTRLHDGFAFLTLGRVAVLAIFSALWYFEFERVESSY